MAKCKAITGSAVKGLTGPRFKVRLGTNGFEQATLHLCASVTKQYNLVLAKWGDLFGWESNRGPGGK